MLDAYELAMLPLAHLMSQSDPFDRYCNQTGGLARAYREVVNNGVWGYQLYTYLALIGVYCGEDTRQQVRGYQLTLFSPDEAHREALENILGVIEAAMGTRAVKVSTDSGDFQVPVEMNVALALLLNMPCSPDFVPDASMRTARIASMGIDVDWRLADCLESVREEVINSWSATIAHCNASGRGFSRGRPLDA
jgi:hypothetical protein